MLRTLVVLLTAAAIAVPLSRCAGFGSVLGHLLAGVPIGPHGAGLITDLGQIESVSSFGVVMLLFLVGLELRPARIWVMRRTVLGFGAAQVEVMRQLGAPVSCANPTRPDVLRAAWAETARLLVVTLDKAEGNVPVLEMVPRNFPHLQIVARARNRRHAYVPMDRGIGSSCSACMTRSCCATPMRSTRMMRG